MGFLSRIVADATPHAPIARAVPDSPAAESMGSAAEASVHAIEPFGAPELSGVPAVMPRAEQRAAIERPAAYFGAEPAPHFAGEPALEPHRRAPVRREPEPPAPGPLVGIPVGTTRSPLEMPPTAERAAGRAAIERPVADLAGEPAPEPLLRDSVRRAPEPQAPGQSVRVPFGPSRIAEVPEAPHGFAAMARTVVGGWLDDARSSPPVPHAARAAEPSLSRGGAAATVIEAGAEDAGARASQPAPSAIPAAPAPTAQPVMAAPAAEAAERPTARERATAPPPRAEPPASTQTADPWIREPSGAAAAAVTVAAAPRVHIGRLEVIVAAPAEPSRRPPRTPSPNLSSRRYLRNA